MVKYWLLSLGFTATCWGLHLTGRFREASRTIGVLERRWSTGDIDDSTSALTNCRLQWGRDGYFIGINYFLLISCWFMADLLLISCWFHAYFLAYSHGSVIDSILMVPGHDDLDQVSATNDTIHWNQLDLNHWNLWTHWFDSQLQPWNR